MLLLLTDDDDDAPPIPLRFVLGLLFVRLPECSFVFACCLLLLLLRLSVTRGLSYGGGDDAQKL